MAEPLIIGYFDEPYNRDIPWCPQRVVLVEEDEPDIYSDFTTPHPDISLEYVRLSEPVLWDRDKVHVLMPTWKKPRHRTFEEADVLLQGFCTSCRQAGYRSLQNDRKARALMMFDRARRVSNEPEDYVRLWVLDEENRNVWETWLETFYPEIDLETMAKELFP